MFWLIRAFLRFATVIKVRVALLSRRVVPIRGLQSYLPYLTEINAQHHISAIVHTRQANPPSIVKSMYVPLVVEKASTVSEVRLLHVKVHVWSAVKCHVYILLDFNCQRFKDLLVDTNDIAKDFD